MSKQFLINCNSMLLYLELDLIYTFIHLYCVIVKYGKNQYRSNKYLMVDITLIQLFNTI